MASTEAPTTTTNNDQYTTYFRHEPYGPRSYAFGFEVNDIKTGNRQFRDERRYPNGTVEGSYGYVRPDGRITINHFIASAERGYLSQTRNLEKGDFNINDTNWHKYFWSTKDQKDYTDHNLDDKGEQVNDSNSAELSSGNANQIDLEKDILNPALSAIINESLPQTGSNPNTVMTFQNVIPNQFPLLPFELPQKVLQNIKSNMDDTNSETETATETETDIKSDKNKNENSVEQTKDVASNQTAKPPILSENSTKKMENNSKSQTDWISSYINEIRKEFLEN